MTPDPAPLPRILNPRLLARLHLQWRECALCGSTASRSLHHVHRHPRDDVRPNLVMLCGHGTTGCHGDVEARDREALESLGILVVGERREFVGYLEAKLGGTQAREWILVNLYAHVA